LNGPLFERAEAIIKFIQRGTDDYVCFSRDKTVRVSFSCCIDGDYCNFTNGGIEFCLAKLNKLPRIDDFSNKCRKAIDLAEKNGKNLNEKLEIFTQTFASNVNVILSEGKPFDVCLRYNWNCYLKEYRGITKYTAWLCGDEFDNATEDEKETPSLLTFHI